MHRQPSRQITALAALAALACACDPPAPGSGAAPSSPAPGGGAASSASALPSDTASGAAMTSSKDLCAALAMRAPFELRSCEARLRRARAADGAVISYLVCDTGPCPVAIERDGKLGAIAVQNLTAAHFLTGKKRSVLVAETRFSKAEGKRVTGSVVMITLDGADPVRAEEHGGDDVDATHDDHVVSKQVEIAVTPAEIHITGIVEERGEGGKVLSSKPVDETYPLPALD